jgi:hypothetical protein
MFDRGVWWVGRGWPGRSHRCRGLDAGWRRNCTSLRLPCVRSANVVRSSILSHAANASWNTAVKRQVPLIAQWPLSGWKQSTNFNGSNARTTAPTVILSGGSARRRPRFTSGIAQKAQLSESMNDDNQVVPRDSVTVCKVPDSAALRMYCNEHQRSERVIGLGRELHLCNLPVVSTRAKP